MALCKHLLTVALSPAKVLAEESCDLIRSRGSEGGKGPICSWTVGYTKLSDRIYIHAWLILMETSLSILSKASKTVLQVVLGTAIS